MQHGKRGYSALRWALVGALVAAGCATSVPKGALQLSPEALERRQLQTRVYDTGNEEELLSACAAVMQDLGYNLDESESRLGLIVGSKERSAVEAGQVIGAIVVGILFKDAPPVDRNQTFRASIVTRPWGREGKRTGVRVTFQRIVWNTENQVTRREAIEDPEVYQQFFTKLSKSVFLDAHEI